MILSVALTINCFLAFVACRSFEKVVRRNQYGQLPFVNYTYSSGPTAYSATTYSATAYAATAYSTNTHGNSMRTTHCPTALPTDVTGYTAGITVARSAGPATPPIGQPDWDFSDQDQANDGPLHLEVETSGGNKSSPVLYGVILEDIDHCIDGGLYAESIQNRAFQNETLEAWYPVGGACVSLNNENSLSTALPMHLSIEMAGRGYGFENIGWWGFSVRPVAYRVSFWARTTKATSFTVKAALVSAFDRKEFVSTEITIKGSDWAHYETTFQPPAAAPNTNNVFVITSTSDESDTLHFNLISVFPPTYNNRPNGVRADLMQNLKDLDLKFCRVPGGNNLEGQEPATRWKWNETIGPLQDRPGRPGDWGYYNTDGMGLLEWLEFCDDLEGEILLGVYAGYSLASVSVPASGLQPYIDDVLHELEYVLGSSSSTYGSLRARDGHPEPFDVKYVEIGNEDFFSNTYDYRFPAFYRPIRTAYPNITIVATTSKGIEFPHGVQFDQHYYGDYRDFIGLFNAYDNWPRNNGTPIVVGEYSVQRFDNQTFAKFPFVEGSVAEAVFGLGIERNADVVITQLYAPFLSNLHYNREGKPRLISFDVDPSQTILSTSYHILKLLSTTHPAKSQNLHIKANIGVYPLYWIASLDITSSVVYVKVANAGKSSQVVSVNLSCSTAAVITGDKLAQNTPENPSNVEPKNLEIRKGASGAEVTMPPWSFAVLTCAKG